VLVPSMTLTQSPRQSWQTFSGVRGGGASAGATNVQWASGLALDSRRWSLRPPTALWSKERLDLADDLAQGAIGIEDLIEETKEVRRTLIDSITAVGAFLSWESRPPARAEAKSFFQVAAGFCWRRNWTRLCPRRRGGRERRGRKSFHYSTVLNLLCILDGQLKMHSMKNRSPSVRALEQHYDACARASAQIGYISQGSVLARSVATSGRSGYQWTRKVAQKTIYRFVK